MTEEKVLVELELDNMPFKVSVNEENLSINSFPKVGKCIVATHLLEGENIPHFHISNKEKQFYCAIRLTNPDYFIHGKYTKKLTNRQRDRVVEWLNEPYKKGSKETNYAGQIFSGLLKVFNTKKLSDVISVFINATIYFVSLAIVIAICAALLTNIVSINSVNTYTVGSAMTVILCGALVFYLGGKADELAKQIGGKINNSFGKQLESDTKTLWGNIKGVGMKVFDAWLKKK